MKSNLMIRVLSAVTLLVFVVALGYFLGIKGVAAFSVLVVLRGAFEYSRMTIRPLARSRALQYSFLITTCIALPIMLLKDGFEFPIWAGAMVVFFTQAIWLTRSSGSIYRTLRGLSLSGMGFAYCVVFPALIIKMLLGAGGALWFIALLGSVFAGDISAYFGGRLLGKHKLMPALSPKKTVEGAIAGLIGSMIFCLVINHYYLNNVPAYYMALLGLLSSVCAQTGDLFESLIKRVAKVKDSGNIMPGHGGVLDRLDGVYFASPIFYIFYVIF